MNDFFGIANTAAKPPQVLEPLEFGLQHLPEYLSKAANGNGSRLLQLVKNAPAAAAEIEVVINAAPGLALIFHPVTLGIVATLGIGIFGAYAITHPSLRTAAPDQPTSGSNGGAPPPLHPSAPEPPAPDAQDEPPAEEVPEVDVDMTPRLGDEGEGEEGSPPPVESGEAGDTKDGDAADSGGTPRSRDFHATYGPMLAIELEDSEVKPWHSPLLTEFEPIWEAQEQNETDAMQSASGEAPPEVLVAEAHGDLIQEMQSEMRRDPQVRQIENDIRQADRSLRSAVLGDLRRGVNPEAPGSAARAINDTIDKHVVELRRLINQRMEAAGLPYRRPLDAPMSADID